MDEPTSVEAVMRAQPLSGFSALPVPQVLLEQVLDVARRAPSGVNTQPWNVHVVQGPALAALVAAARVELNSSLLGDAAQQARFWKRVDEHPGTADWPAQDPTQAGDTCLSAAVALASSDPSRGHAALARYFRFFDAPVALLFTISRDLGTGSLVDYGMFLQNIALAARARDLDTVVQTGWRGVSRVVLETLDAPQGSLLVAGMAIGYPDATQEPIAGVPGMASVDSFTTWHD